MEPTALLGQWTLRRRVVDRLAGLHGTVDGTLVLAADGDGVTWRESGTFRYAGSRFESSRELLLRHRADGWWVLFADGREFHPWAPGAVVDHPCRADHYRGLIDARPDRLRTLWDVRGPAKDQRLVTVCTRSVPAG